MFAIERLPDATAASIQASLLAVTIEDICRILFSNAVEQCHRVLGTSCGRLSLLVDYATWSISVTLDVDHGNQLSARKEAQTGLENEHELELLSYLGLLHITSTSSTGTTVCIWQDGCKTQPQISSPVPSPPPSNTVVSGRGITISLRDAFASMPVRRKLMASEAMKKSHADSLGRCVRELSLLTPDASVQLSIRSGPASDGRISASKVLFSLPRATDIGHRCMAAFGPGSVELNNLQSITAEHIFTSVRWRVNGFVCLTPTANAPQLVFFQGRTWPRNPVAPSASQRSERESAAFASLLSTFKLEWTDEPGQRLTRQERLSPDMYKQISRRILGLPGAREPDEETRAAHAFVLNIRLSQVNTEEQAASQLNARSELTVSSFQAALLDAVCIQTPTAAPSTLRKRKRSSRPSTAIELGGQRSKATQTRSRPATASLALESYGPAAAVPEGMIEWRDPIHGRLFHVDRRTGHSIAVRPGSIRDGEACANEFSGGVRRGKMVDRSKLKKGLHWSTPFRHGDTEKDNATSEDEFDDPNLDAALASIPSPAAAPSTDFSRHSRFFDSRRTEPPSALHPLRSVPPNDAQGRLERPNASVLELAITRSGLQTATVIDQVDAKFILCSASSGPSSDPVLFCIDQHAADERYRLERLLGEYVCDCSTRASAHALSSVFTLGITHKQYEAVTQNNLVRRGLEKLGWTVQQAVLVHAALGHAQVDLSGIPYILKEKVLTERGRVKDQSLLQSAFYNCLEELVVSSGSHSITSANTSDWLTMSRAIPTSLMDVIKSTACRSAIMFNDPLSKVACQRIVTRLGECRFPFQCAHGRPSLVPLCEIKTLQQRQGGCPKESRE